MLETTFIGHQGWQFATANARILVDPLLVESFGHNGGVGAVYPPRVLNVSAMQQVDAIVLTHEHEDHFNIPSLNRVSRKIPVFIPQRSSSALRQILSEMGFTTSLLAAGRTLELRDLQLTVFAPDHVRHDEQDEWETMPFLVRDLQHGGSFFSPVDVATSETIEAQLRQSGATPSLWGYANNAMNLSFQEAPGAGPPSPMPIAARFLLEHIRRAKPPLASLMCGGGFAFTNARAWMNHLFFPLDSERLFSALQTISPHERFIALTPGMQITVDKDGIVDVNESVPFLCTLPRSQWPDRTYKPGLTPPDGVTPASGRDTLGAGDLEELEERLVDFAAFLYGGALFRTLYTLPAGANPKAAFAIIAVSGEQSHVFEYDPPAGRFVRLDTPTSLSAYAAGVQCHATDLLDYLRGRLMPSALMFGRLLRWRGHREISTAAIDQAIWAYGHPLRRQAQYLDLYRAIYANEPAEAPQVQPRSG